MGRVIMGVIDDLFGVHKELDCLKKQRQIVGTKFFQRALKTNGRNTGRTSRDKLPEGRQSNCWCTKHTSMLAFQRVAKVAICLSPQMASLMTHTHAAMCPHRPMLFIQTLNWDHSPSTHGEPSPLTKNFKGKDQSIMRHNGGLLAM